MYWIVVFGVLLFEFCIVSNGQSRYLVYPPGFGNKVQFIVGIGVPASNLPTIQSVTWGYVIKTNYVLPTNVTEYGDIRSVRKRSARISRWDFYRSIADVLNRALGDSYTNYKSNSRIWAESPERGRYEKCNGPLSSKRVFRGQTLFFVQICLRKPKFSLVRCLATQRDNKTRWVCLERNVSKCSICETSQIKFSTADIIGELLHIMLLPSSTGDTQTDYYRAELVGLNHPVSCASVYNQCPVSIIDLISVVRGDFNFGSFPYPM